MGRSRYQNTPILNSKWINWDLAILISRSTHQKMDYTSYWFTGKPVYKLLFDSSNECIHECSVQFLPELYILF